MPARLRLAALAALTAGVALWAVDLEGDARAQPGAGLEDGRPFGEPIRFRHLGPEDGLPNPWVSAVHQDSLGFLWFGTQDGLARYDGDAMRVYQSVPFDATSLHGTWVTGIAEDDGAGLWALTGSGALDRYDPTRDDFSAPAPNVVLADANVVLAGPGGDVWIGGRTAGLYRHDPARGTTEAVGGTSDQVTALAHDGRALWVGTADAGIARLDGRTVAAFPHDPADPSTPPSDFVSALLVDRRGRLWVGTDRGLAVGRGGRFETVEALRGDAVWALLEDPAGDVWAGTDDGLVRYDPETGRAARYRHDPADPASLGAGRVLTLFLDRARTLWVGTATGLSSVAWGAPPLDHVAPRPDVLGDTGVWSVLDASDGTLWVGMAGGLDGFAPDGTVRRVRSDGTAATIGPGMVVSLYQEPRGTLLVGTQRHLGRPGVLTRIDPETGAALDRFDLSNGLPTDSPWAIRTDRRGRLWVLASGDDGCPAIFDPDAGTFEPHCLTVGGDRLAAKVFAEDEAGRMWFGTFGGGLVHYDPETRETVQVAHDPADPDTPPGDVIEAVVEAPGGRFWVGTYGGGLSLFDPTTGAFRHWHTANSALPTNVIWSAETDDRGHVWMGTNVGLVRFDPGAETFETFGLADGAQDVEFNGGVSHVGRDGTMYFGGINGVNRFDPLSVGARAGAVRPVVTAVTVEGQPAELGGALAVAAPLAEAVRLGPRERDVSFRVAAPGTAGTVRYRVRLDGLEDEWHAPGPGRTATYTNLEPGRYAFRAQAATGATWDGPERTLAVIVAPRWFQAWWSRLLAALATVAVAVTVVRRRVRLTRERQAALEAEVADRTVALRERTVALEAEKATTEAQAERLREVARLRTRFFTNVSHEFRTPLTLTIGPLEDLEGQDLPGDAGVSVDLALRNSRRLLRLTNQLLDAARIEAGEMTLRARPLDLGARVRATALSFAPLAERRRVTFGVETPPDALEVWADADKLDAVVANLLSNAFKFTPEGGAVSVAVLEAEGGAQVRVRDNGAGIAPRDLPHVFDRFYRAEETGGADGTGIGLSLARDLAVLHGGALEAESIPGLGSVFTLTLRLGRGHLEDDQVAPADPTGPPALEVAAAGPDDAARSDEPDDRTTVLVADDNADIRAYVRSHLAGYRVLEAADGARALELARRETPDLVVSDIMMPGLDGVGLVRALRADPETDFVPVVLLTAKAEEADVQVGLDAGADAYMVKPFNAQTLQAQVSNLIASRQSLRARFAALGDGAAVERPGNAGGAASPFVARARAAVEDRLGDETFTVSDFADALGVTRSTLHRRLASETDTTPSAFVRDLRLEHARRLLEDGAGTVSEVGYAVGFKSVSHFSRSFRDRYGATPSSVGRGDAAPTSRAG